jgi:hypothetical protein
MRGWSLSHPLGEPSSAHIDAALRLDELIQRLGGALLHGRVPHEADQRARRPFIGLVACTSPQQSACRLEGTLDPLDGTAWKVHPAAPLES